MYRSTKLEDASVQCELLHDSRCLVDACVQCEIQPIIASTPVHASESTSELSEIDFENTHANLSMASYEPSQQASES